MAHYLSDEELQRTAPAETASFPSPVPTQIVSNGEYNPLPQTREQAQVEARVKELADELARRHGMGRRRFLASTAGMAAAFLAMNEVFGPLFDVSRAEAQTPGVADQRAGALAGQFIFDDQTTSCATTSSRTGCSTSPSTPRRTGTPRSPARTTSLGSSSRTTSRRSTSTATRRWRSCPARPSTTRRGTSSPTTRSRPRAPPSTASRARAGCSATPSFTPKHAGWMAEVDRCIATVKPDSWKGYTVGDPLSPSKLSSYWRLDDEKLMYPFYEKAVKAGINTICIHKGLLPADYEKSWPGVWQYNTVWDVGKAAKDWPQINFVIYHAALRPFLEPPDAVLAEFEQTGRINWVTDLAEIPAKFGVTNVYGEIGTAFATCAVSSPPLRRRVHRHPREAAWAWTTWSGAPTRCGTAPRSGRSRRCRRLEIPADMQKKHGFAPLGAAPMGS